MDEGRRRPGAPGQVRSPRPVLVSVCPWVYARRLPPWYPTTTTPSAAKTPPGPSPCAVLAEAGPDGLTEMVVELTLKLAEALERIAAEQGLAAADLAEVWFAE